MRATVNILVGNLLFSLNLLAAGYRYAYVSACVCVRLCVCVYYKCTKSKWDFSYYYRIIK